MPVFASGTPLQIRKKEAARTLGGQVQSLTFIDRANPLATIGHATSNPLGMLLEAATNSLMFAGVSKRLVPRFQIGSRSGREYQQQIAVSGGEGSLNLVFNPNLFLHRELMDPPKDAQYHIVSFMAPPYMNCVAGVYDHVRSGAVTLDPENQATMEVAFLDNFGARYVPGRLYQKTGTIAAPISGIATVNFSVLDDSDNTLKLGVDSAGDDINLITDNLTVTINLSGANVGQINLNAIVSGPDLASGTGQDTLILLHIPGETGGYALSPNLNNTDLSSTTTIETNLDLTKRMLDNANNAMYLGIYSIDEDDLLFRN